MSRVAKKPIALVKGVELNIQADSVSVKGPKGTLSIAKPAGVEIVTRTAMRSRANDRCTADGGISRVIANMVQGVARLRAQARVVGCGYRAAMQGKDRTLARVLAPCVQTPDGSTIDPGPDASCVGHGQAAGQLKSLQDRGSVRRSLQGKGVTYAARNH